MPSLRTDIYNFTNLNMFEQYNELFWLFTQLAKHNSLYQSFDKSLSWMHVPLMHFPGI